MVDQYARGGRCGKATLRGEFIWPDEADSVAPMTDGFHGAKAAVFIGARLLVYQRDEDIVWPGHWDFPGGGREGRETPFACLRREVKEEFGVSIDASAISWKRAFPSMVNPSETAWFFVVHLPPETEDAIVFGDEGQQWALMLASDVANLPNLVPALRERLTLWLQETGGLTI